MLDVLRGIQTGLDLAGGLCCDSRGFYKKGRIIPQRWKLNCDSCFEAVIVKAIPLSDQVHLQCDAVMRVTHDGERTIVTPYKSFRRLVLAIREFPRYELALDFQSLVDDAHKRYLTVLRTHPEPIFGLVKFDDSDSGRCPDCRGTGEYRGLIVIEVCGTCQGSGDLGSVPGTPQLEEIEMALMGLVS